MIKIIIILISLLVSAVGGAQPKEPVILTLEECLEIALQNNLGLERSVLLKDASVVNFKSSKSELFPTLNANYNLGVSNGRSIDPYTNDYVDQKLTISNAGLSLNFTVFNGFKLLNTIRARRSELNAAKMEVEEQKQNLKLKVTLAYLQILNSKDLLNLAKNRLETTEKQLQRLKSLYQEEVGNPADYTDMKGQLASDMSNVISAENELEQAKLDLFLLLNMDNPVESQFVTIEEKNSLENYPYSSDEVYAAALVNQATFKAKQFRLDAAKMSVKVARSGYIPEISLFGQLNTNYSSAAQFFTETGSSIVETGGFVTFNDVDYPVLQNEASFLGEDIDYVDQIRNNVYTSFGVSVSIPLLNGFQSKSNVALEKIQLEESKLDLQIAKSNFKNAVEHAYIQMETALERYHIYQKQSEAFDESFRINEIRFNNGVSNIVEYLTSKNNIDNALINLANARYEYLLRVMVLDYYRGV